MPENFYPRPPRGGRPPCAYVCQYFLNFYPRPPRGGRRVEDGSYDYDESISIHALREEGDHRPADGGGGIRISIHALREEGDIFRQLHKFFGSISIHALREEGDDCHLFGVCELYDFYPRPPRGGRP